MIIWSGCTYLIRVICWTLNNIWSTVNYLHWISSPLNSCGFSERDVGKKKRQVSRKTQAIRMVNSVLTLHVLPLVVLLGNTHLCVSMFLNCFSCCVPALFLADPFLGSWSIYLCIRIAGYWGAQVKAAKERSPMIFRSRYLHWQGISCPGVFGGHPIPGSVQWGVLSLPQSWAVRDASNHWAAHPQAEGTWDQIKQVRVCVDLEVLQAVLSKVKLTTAISFGWLNYHYWDMEERLTAKYSTQLEMAFISFPKFIRLFFKEGWKNDLQPKQS